MIENLTDYTFVRLPNPQNANDQYELESWKKQLDLHWKCRGIYKSVLCHAGVSDTNVNMQVVVRGPVRA